MSGKRQTQSSISSFFKKQKTQECDPSLNATVSPSTSFAIDFTDPPQHASSAIDFTDPPQHASSAIDFTDPPQHASSAAGTSTSFRKSVNPPLTAIAPTDIAQVVDWPEGPSRAPDNIKHRILTSTSKPPGTEDVWPSSTTKNKTSRITSFVYQRYNWLHYSTAHNGLYCKLCAIFAPSESGQGPNKLKQLVTQPKKQYKNLSEKLNEHSKKHYHKLCVQKAVDFLR